VADSVGDPVGYYRNNVLGTLATLEAMAAEACRVRVLVDLRRLRRAGRDADSRDAPTAPINAYGQTKLAIEQALPHYERAYGCARSGCATSTPRAPIPTGELGEDHTPRSTSSARLRGRRRRGAASIFGEDYPTPGRHLSARLHSRRRSGHCARARAPHLEAGGRRSRTTSAPSASSVREVIRRSNGSRRRCGVPTRAAAGSGGALASARWRGRTRWVRTPARHDRRRRWRWHRTLRRWPGGPADVDDCAARCTIRCCRS
jgi:hypothetical protein